MGTFLEFYTTLLGFVNYKLYSDINIVYPPKLDKNLEDEGAELDAFKFESTEKDDFIESFEKEQYDQESKPKLNSKKMRIRMDSLEEKISKIKSMEIEEEEDETAVKNSVPTPSTPAENLDETVTSLDNIIEHSQQDTIYSSLFSGCKIYLNREVPRYALEFVIRSFGGRVGWDDIVGSGSPFGVDDPGITHHIIDRPEVLPDLKKFDQREFLQPQWVFDCVNARKLVATDGYHTGETLPNHLSPFVVADSEEYDPTNQDQDADDDEPQNGPSRRIGG